MAKMETCPRCGKNWTGGLPQHRAICPGCGHNGETEHTPSLRPDGTPHGEVTSAPGMYDEPDYGIGLWFPGEES